MKRRIFWPDQSWYILLLLFVFFLYLISFVIIVRAGVDWYISVSWIFVGMLWFFSRFYFNRIVIGEDFVLGPGVYEHLSIFSIKLPRRDLEVSMDAKVRWPHLFFTGADPNRYIVIRHKPSGRQIVVWKRIFSTKSREALMKMLIGNDSHSG